MSTTATDRHSAGKSSGVGGIAMEVRPKLTEAGLRSHVGDKRRQVVKGQILTHSRRSKGLLVGLWSAEGR